MALPQTSYKDGRRRWRKTTTVAAAGGPNFISISWPHDSNSPASHSLHAKGFSIAIAHSTLNPPNPSNHPNNFIFLPLSDNLSAIDASSSFTSFIQTLNANCEPSFRQHLTRLIAQRGDYGSIVIIYDFLMFFAGAVAVDLNLSSIIFRSSSATYFTAFLARMQLIQKGQFLEQEFVMQDMVPGLHPLRYKDLPFSKSPIEDWHQLLAIFSQQRNPSAVIWNTLEFLEHEALSQIHKHYQVPVFAVGPLHKITPSPPTSFLEEDTSCIAWLDKQAPKSVVYVSLGSLVTLDAKVLVEMAWGLAKSKQPFLWAVRPGSVSDSEWSEFLPDDFREETSGRGLIVKWAPKRKFWRMPRLVGFGVIVVGIRRWRVFQKGFR
ncbi:hypothetical protein OSB04_001236 [Centaurea solstitialis]|uniref:UDP-glycosyltransferase n=1 Tax=Centaurea solstitialis TaxID=347529 RepID=A0AA38U2C3_9ASTR|nr:hypothetical protein OSB04_001236 [Centaurea solstitialis]